MLSDSVRVGTAFSAEDVAFIAIDRLLVGLGSRCEQKSITSATNGDYNRRDSPSTMSTLPILFTREQIEMRVDELAAKITRDFAGESLLLVGVLKGAAVFLSDLSRAVELDTSFDFISVASYKEGTTSSGEVRLQKDLDDSIEGRNVLLVEDILDTGLTMTYIHGLLLARKPKTLKVIALLDKPSRRVKPFKADYVGFEVANQFVVGYGMDHAERYRNLPDIRFVPSA